MQSDIAGRAMISGIVKHLAAGKTQLCENAEAVHAKMSLRAPKTTRRQHELRALAAIVQPGRSRIQSVKPHIGSIMGDSLAPIR